MLRRTRGIDFRDVECALVPISTVNLIARAASRKAFGLATARRLDSTRATYFGRASFERFGESAHFTTFPEAAASLPFIDAKPPLSH